MGVEVRLELQAGEYLLDAPLSWDALAGASELLVIAAPGALVRLRPAAAARRRLQSEGAGTLLNVSAGVVTIEGVELRGAAPAVTASGGRLTVRNCTLADNLGRALLVSGGEVTMEDCVLASNGGGVRASGGTLSLLRSTVTGNSAERGGATRPGCK